MKKWMKIIVPAICVLIVVITFYMIFDIRKKVDDVNYNTNDIEVENVVEENTVDTNTLVENAVVETDKTNTVSENTVNSSETDSSGEEVSEENDAYANSKFSEAENLVKKAWGEDDTVYFTIEGVNSEGLYLVAAREKATTNVRNYFKVNLETKKVEVDY